MARTVVTPERFATGMTFDEYVRTPAAPRTSPARPSAATSPTADRWAPPQDNSAVLRDRYPRAA